MALDMSRRLGWIDDVGVGMVGVVDVGVGVGVDMGACVGCLSFSFTRPRSHNPT